MKNDANNEGNDTVVSEPYREFRLLQEEFEKNRPDIQDECLAWAHFFRMKAKAVQLNYQRKHPSEQKSDSIIKRIIQFLGFSSH